MLSKRLSAACTTISVTTVDTEDLHLHRFWIAFEIAQHVLQPHHELDRHAGRLFLEDGPAGFDHLFR